jgi:hypothetical protein
MSNLNETRTHILGDAYFPNRSSWLTCEDMNLEDKQNRKVEYT